MNLVIGLLVGLGSIFLPALIGGLLAQRREHIFGLIGSSIVVSLIYGALVAFFRWSSVAGLYGPTPLFGWILFGAIIAGIIAFNASNEEGISTLPSIIVGCVVLLYSGFISIIGSDMMNSDAKARLIGNVVDVKELHQAIQPADPTHICLVSEGMAITAAQNALSKFKTGDGAAPGSRYEIGSPTKQFVDGQLWWVFPLEFSSYFKWNDQPIVPGYLRVSAEDPFQEGQAVQSNKQGRAIQIRYLNSSYFGSQAERYLRENGFMGAILKDWTFEVDDDWDPYYTVSVVERTLGYSGLVTKGVIVFNVEDGTFNYEELAKLPSWVDRAIPLNDVIDANAIKWGEYAHASWGHTFFNSDMSQKPTQGWFLTYGKNGDCQWFSGFTSMNSKDDALTGFMLTDARTGVSTFVHVAGVTENRAYDAAKSLWSNFTGYEPTDLTPYNIYGTLTYVVPMMYEHQFKGVSLVSINNVQLAARGATFEEALSNYRAIISSSGEASIAPAGGEIPEVILSGIIEFTGQPVFRAQQQVFTFKMKSVPKLFEVAYTNATAEVPLMRDGSRVTIRFQDTKEKIITCRAFHIEGITLSDESNVQAEHLANLKVVKKEVTRVDKAEKRTTLLESNRLQSVDPDSLDQFLKNQKHK
ncbi:MAG: hypothetical protein WCW78_00435 [Candidatus Paceibacterota bacterium]|jgi:hypothetical protein